MASRDKSELLKQLVSEDKDDQAEDLSFRIWHLFAVALVAALVGACIVFLLSETPSKNSNSAAIASAKTVESLPSASGTSKKSPTTGAVLNASGYVTARRLATVSAEIMGLISEVNVDEGMRVEAQQVLARLDDAKAKVNLQLAQAQVRSQEQQVKSFTSDLQEAQRVLARLSRLRNENYSSEAQRTRAEADVAKLQANLSGALAERDVARLNVARAQENLDDHTIRAPFSGVITVKNAQPGEIVAPAAAGGGFTRTGICTLVDMQSLEIQVDVNEAYIGRVTPGQKVIANLDAYPGWDINASVIAIIPTANRAKATVQVRIKILTLDSRILPNMGVKVAFFDEQVKS